MDRSTEDTATVQDHHADPRGGHPLELNARQRDATAAERGGPEFGESLNVYRLESVAAPNDPRWENSPFQGTVVVAARSSGDARVVASARELDFMEIEAKPAEDVTTSMASAFRSEKLYTVIEIERGRTELSRGVLEGEIALDIIRPMQD